jgi:5-methylcytosine-specific restriction endonuclease McrA
MNIDNTICEPFITERIIEYERRLPFKNFTNKHLFPNEPNFRNGDSSNLALQAKDDFALLAGWKWIDNEWSVLMGTEANSSGTDNNGWMYAFNWAGDKGYSSKCNMKDLVRKRIWIRRRIPLISYNNINENKSSENKPRKKKAIPAAIKKLVWNTYIGEDIGKAKCTCCKNTDITQMSFNCGHIIAEANGGELIVSNLKPICQNCNSSMGTKNMDDFMKGFK